VQRQTNRLGTARTVFDRPDDPAGFFVPLDGSGVLALDGFGPLLVRPKGVLKKKGTEMDVVWMQKRMVD